MNDSLTLTIELTYACPLQCIHCSSTGIATSLTLPTIQTILDTYPNIHQINLSGGEPLSYPEINDLIALLTFQGYKLHLFTSGIGILRSASIAQIATIVVSLYGDRAFHEFVTGTPSFDATITFLHKVSLLNTTKVIVSTPIFDVLTKTVIEPLESFDLPLHLTRLLPHGRAANLHVLTREQQLQIATSITEAYPFTTISQSLRHDQCHWNQKLTLLPDGTLIQCVAGKQTRKDGAWTCDRI